MELFGDREALYAMPEVFPAALFDYPGVKQLFYSGPAWRGRPTRVFACCGVPEGASPENPVPGVVLIHGGGATALADWVALWNRRGYAAISMDTCGCVPGWSVNPYCNRSWPRHEFSGPSGWSESMHEADLPPEEQWPYHAVRAAAAAHTLLRSMPGVDPERTGVTGISWGGVLTCLAAGTDDRYGFAIPVYGCGFFNTPESGLGYDNPRLTPELRRRWFELWDPAHRLGNIACPTLFFSGSNDFAFPFDALRKSYRAVPAAGRRLSVRLAYPHNHTECWSEETVFDFAAASLEGRALPSLARPEIAGETVRCGFDAAGAGGVSGVLNFTRASGLWPDRAGSSVPARIEGGAFTAPLPRGAKAVFFHLLTADGRCYSSEFIEC